MAIYVYYNVNINWSINCQMDISFLKVLRLTHVGIILAKVTVLH